MNKTEDQKTIEEQVDDFLACVDDGWLDELLQDDISPMEKLLALILNEATKKHASDIAVHTDEKKCYVAYKISGEWIDQERPPQYLWDQIRNLYMTMAGVEYWQKGILKGLIKQEDILQEWDFEISEDHKKLKFKPRTKAGI
jgi:type II secretory ATPase GspE/PulE/Tfp pilus assembly ATPase PilB-like protein